MLTAIILLQIIAIVIWYNESKLSEAFDEMAAVEKVGRINNSIIKSQGYFNTYITDKDEVALQNYGAALEEVNAYLDGLPIKKLDKEIRDSLLIKKKKTQLEIIAVKALIDSIIEKQVGQDGFSKNFKFKEFETRKFLDDVKTDSYVKVDSATRKGLFSRLGDAIANRANVQKEYVNTVVTMQYKDQVTTGNVEQQLAQAINITNDYYAKEFNNLKKSFSSLRTNDLKLMQLNNQLLMLSQALTADYSRYLSKPGAQQELQERYDTNKAVRNYSLVFLIILMFVVSVILFSFTRVAFEYEKRLTLAQAKIRESLNFKNRITGMISHEIRSPLSIISMYSKKASNTVKEAELKETFKSIEFTTNSLLLLSNQILEYSKEENHELTLQSKKIHLKAEINQIINSMASLVETKGNTLKVNSNLKDEDVVHSDKAKIHQLFYNLIGNANKFTENGYIDISISLKPISGFEMDLSVLISDNGIGIAESDLKNIFDSYYQGTVSEKVNDLGVGLGLNICKEIIELFDGEISIESKPGEGTQVKFNLILALE